MPVSAYLPGRLLLPTWGWRGDAMRRLLSVTWPLTHLELPGSQLSYALTDRRAQRAKALFVLATSGSWAPPSGASYGLPAAAALARPEPMT